MIIDVLKEECELLEKRLVRLSPNFDLEKRAIDSLRQTWLEVYDKDELKAYENYKQSLNKRISSYHSMYLGGNK